MTALKVIVVVLLLLFLLGLVRVGGAGEYSAGGVLAWVWVGPFRVRVFPLKEKKKKKPKKAKEGPPKPEGTAEEAPKKGGALEQARQYLPLVCEAAGELKRRIRIDRLLLDYMAPGKEDAASAAMNFGLTNAAVGIILSLFEQNFDVKDRRVRTAVDFNAESPTLYVYAAISARLGQLCAFALRFGWKFFKVYRQTKNPKKEAI